MCEGFDYNVISTLLIDVISFFSIALLNQFRDIVGIPCVELLPVSSPPCILYTDFRVKIVVVNPCVEHSSPVISRGTVKYIQINSQETVRRSRSNVVM